MISQDTLIELRSKKRKKASTLSETPKYDQYFYGHGKLLLSSEYFVLDGAKGLALPTILGQSMGVSYGQSFNPILHWKSYDSNGDLWFECRLEFWHFDIIDEKSTSEAIFLQKILREARKQNKHFLRDNVDVLVETKLDFPLNWGLGSSSTLIYNIAQWAYISPFELMFNTCNGSGYDIACAQSDGPILYSNGANGPKWETTSFRPSFRNQLYFVYLGRKQDSREAIEYFNQRRPYPSEVGRNLSSLTEEMLKSEDLNEFEFLINAHETLIGQALNIAPVKERQFADYWGSVKSLGAWGGDFVLVTSTSSEEKTKSYFESRGYNVFIPYEELVLTPSLDMEYNRNDYLQ